MGGGYRADRGAAAGRRASGCAPSARAISGRTTRPRPTTTTRSARPTARSHERLARADRLYDIFLVTDWNWPDAVPGTGSAIFVHVWRRPRNPTAGCLAFRPDHLRWILARWTPRSRIFVR